MRAVVCRPGGTIIVLVVAVGVIFLCLTSELLRASLALDDPRIKEIQSMTQQALRLHNEGKTAEAIELWKKRHALVLEVVGSEYTESVAGSLEILAQLYEAHGDSGSAKKNRQDVIRIREKADGPKHWKTTDARLALARLEQNETMDPPSRRRLADAAERSVKAFAAYKQGNFDEAAKEQQAALDTQRQILGDMHPVIANSRNSLGFFAQQRGDYPTARHYYEQVLRIRLHVLGDTHPETARAYRALGNVLVFLGEREKALAAYERCHDSFVQALGESDNDAILALESVASNRQFLGDSGNATIAYQKLVRIKSDKYGNGAVETAGASNSLALQLMINGDYREALRIYTDTLDLFEKYGEANRLDAALSLIGMGNCLTALEEDIQAQRCFERAYNIRRGALGEGHVQTAEVRGRLISLYEKHRDFKKAKAELEELMQLYQKAKEPNRISLHTATIDLGMLLYRTGRPVDALRLFEEAIRICDAGVSFSLEDKADDFSRCGACYVSLGRWNEAVDAIDQSRRLVRTNIQRSVWGLTEREQLRFLQRADQLTFHKSLSLAIAKSADQRIAEHTATWLANGKSVTQEVLASRILLTRQQNDNAVGPQVRELFLVREQLAALSLSDPAPAEQARHQQELSKLSEREDSLIREIAKANGEARVTLPWVELETIRKALPARSALIDVAKVRVWNFQVSENAAQWLPSRYIAWIIPPLDNTMLQVIDLGDASEIDTAIQKCREQVQGAATKIKTIGEVDAEKELRQSLHALAKLVLKPLLRHIDSATTWIISPDSDLWLVPWAMLPLADGSYAVERHQISYVVSSRDLARAPFQGENTAPVILADPDYDLLPTPVKAEHNELRGAPRSPREIGKIQWPRLPGTANEAASIEAKLAAYAGVKPIVHTGEEATEMRFKALNKPKVLVLSTHGYFLEDQGTDAALPPLVTNRPSGSLQGLIEVPAGVKTKPVENPLLRCGLILAGANRRQQRTDPSSDDGVLTGLEIVGTDLRGCQLVVLSACETGLGEVRNGEGVAGLRQAFQLAGAQTVVATLWQVPDRQSAQLMSSFFDNLASGQNKANALRNAQLKLIAARRDQNAAAHPFFWAAFTVTGSEPHG